MPQFPTWTVDTLSVACHVLVLVFSLTSSLELVSFLGFQWQVWRVPDFRLGSRWNLVAISSTPKILCCYRRWLTVLNINWRTFTFLIFLNSCVLPSLRGVFLINYMSSGVALLPSSQHGLPSCPKLFGRDMWKYDLWIDCIEYCDIWFILLLFYICHMLFLCIPCLYSLSRSIRVLLVNLICGDGIQIKRKIRVLCNQLTSWQ